ncbi:MAG: nuclear transport factor 2 family protein [Pseudomonadota bacterium]
MSFSALLAAVAAQAASPSVTIPPQPQLTQQIRDADAALFKLFFEGPCDTARFRSMITDDVEFYHDKGGFNVRKPADFVGQFEERCAKLADPTSFRQRRELVESSLHVDPIPGWGAMEIGDHQFYEKRGTEGEWKLVGKASFSMVWVLGADGKWRVSRVLSYAHGPAK